MMTDVNANPVHAVLFDLDGTLIDNVLKALGLGPRMRAVVGAEEVARGKPAPDLFVEGARRLGCTPAHTLVFEDAVSGVQAGRAAGMRVCGVTTSEASETLLAAGALATVTDFRAIPLDLLKRLSRQP